MSPGVASILIVEDDESLRVTLADNLELKGYAVRTAANGADARRLIAEARPGLILLDVMLPDVDGYRLASELRAGGDKTPILMLTARTLEEDVVRGFDSGADDYLAKPYRLKELLARVAALLRRAGVQGGLRTFAGFRLDTEARKLLDERGAEIELTRKEFDLLLLFADNVDRAFSRDEILDRVWGEDVVVDGRTVDNFVSSLKKKLRWTPDAPFRLRTVRGVGYRMEVDPSGPRK